MWFYFLYLSLGTQKKKKKVGLFFLPITLTKPVEESDSHLYDLEILRPKGALLPNTIHGHFSFYILVNWHSQKGVILLVRVIDRDYQNQLYWYYATDTRNIVWIPGNSWHSFAQ